MPYRPIEDYGVIGDMHSAALVGRDGSIDWLCFPRFDAPSVFAAILDDEKGGRFRIRPAGDYDSAHSYVPDTNILSTRFLTSAGEAFLTDLMPVEEDVRTCHHEVLRVLRCDQGSVEFELEYQPRLDCARSPTAVTVEGRSTLARLGDDCLAMTASVPLEAIEGGARARFTLKAGESAAFLLCWNDAATPLPEDYDVYGRLGRTQAFWRFVCHDWRYHGRWADTVKRSMLALHLLLYVPSGAVCAAVTTSLPEQIGGARNWDYRYCWLRDATFTLDIFNRLGHTDYTRPFIQWVAKHAATLTEEHDIHSLYGIGRELKGHGPSEITLEHLEGYRGSRPVRDGNAAFHQFQLDVYGEVIVSLDSYHRAGGVVDDDLWMLTEFMVEAAIRHWKRPDNGIWEVRSEPKHFTFSKVMAWLALDRGLRLATALRRPVDFPRWRAVRAEIADDILKNGWNAKRGSFTQSYGSDNLDASVLFLPMVGFLPASDPRMLATIDAVRDELSEDGLLRRYLPHETDDGVSGPEGTFTMCSLWLAGALISAGRVQEARELFEGVLGRGNELALFSEMLEPGTGAYLGNYPQAFTHIALIHTARNLDRALSQEELGKVVAA